MHVIWKKYQVITNNHVGDIDRDLLKKDFSEWMAEYKTAWLRENKISQINLIEKFINEIVELGKDAARSKSSSRLFCAVQPLSAPITMPYFSEETPEKTAEKNTSNSSKKLSTG